MSGLQMDLEESLLSGAMGEEGLSVLFLKA